MSNVEQEADNSKRNSEESDVVLKNQQMVRVQQMDTVEWIQQKSKDKDSADDIISRKIYQQRASTSSWYLELANAKRCRLHKLIRHRFAFTLWIQQILFAMRKTSRNILLTTSWCKSNDDQLECKSNVNQQLVATVHSDESYNEPAVAMHQVASLAYPVAVFEVPAVASNQRLRWKESMAEIKSCKLPQFKGTRFRLFKGEDLKEKGGRWCRCEAVAENTLIAQCTSRGKMNRKTKQSTAIREESSRESIAEC
ncbi:hypothetical protein F511_04115 [Dorcoceras hygrometricum]|nr:hypothetical protein F511_04115 [Dorcoceras hygrometricum]